jgi:hypothetical protein
MHWKVKAKAQSLIAILPSSLSYGVYLWIQRHFGGLRAINPSARLAAAVEIWRRNRYQGQDPIGKVFFEVGTGRSPVVPLAYWLFGAERTITMDLNPYMDPELVEECLHYIVRNICDVKRILEPYLVPTRLEDLQEFIKYRKFSQPDFLHFAGIDYIAPGNASKTELSNRVVDYHTSYTVFEHISSDDISAILCEGNRIVKESGIFVHCVDYSDHFSHGDHSIPAINFLQYSERKWAKYAGNRYMYMNRLRHDDVLELFASAGHRILSDEPITDSRSMKELTQGRIHVDERFRAKSIETLSVSSAWIVSEKRESTPKERKG